MNICNGRPPTDVIENLRNMYYKVMLVLNIIT